MLRLNYSCIANYRHAWHLRDFFEQIENNCPGCYMQPGFFCYGRNLYWCLLIVSPTFDPEFLTLVVFFLLNNAISTRANNPDLRQII